MNIKNFNIKIITLILIWTCIPRLYAQDKMEVSVGADIVSSYIWRGQDLGGFSLQPTLSISYKGFSLEAWGSTGFEKQNADGYNAREIDLTLRYAPRSFSLSITDYWTTGDAGYFHYGTHNTSHVFEAQIGYDFGWLDANWYTNFAGNDGVNKNGHRAYASYISLSVPFRLGGLDWTAEIGASPWANSFYNDWTNGFCVCNIGLEACKEIKITDSFSLPLFAKVIWNPRTEGAHFVAGINF